MTDFIDPKAITDADNYPHKAAQSGTKTSTVPRDATGGAKDGGSKAKRTAVEKKLQEKSAANAKSRQLARQVRMVDTTEGTHIDSVDDANFS
ncbi:hypothetical protein OY671_012769, partial [Metschnikowia pulcherrima]